MKKNGFTLIELLAVIVILLIIVIVSTPNIINLINKSDEQKKVTIEERLKDAAKEYVTSYDRSVLNSLVTLGSKITIPTNSLVEAGLIKQSDVDLLEEDAVFVQVVLQANNKLAYSVQYGNPYIYTFTHATATGFTGPTQTQVDTEYLGTALEGSVTTCSGIQLWTAPYTGTYKIEAWGAQGGLGACNGTPGNGAYISGTFSLTAGDNILIIVGQKGSDNTTTGITDGTTGAGGGGSFVVKRDNAATDTMTATGTCNGWKVTPLIVAAGGNGGRDICYSGSGAIIHGQGTTGSVPTYVNYYGGGFNTCWSSNTSGSSFLAGGASGTDIYTRASASSTAGYGSGGSNKDDGEGGGGGGYFGGGPGVPAYSYNGGTSPTNQTGINTTNGKVIITYIP